MPIFTPLKKFDVSYRNKSGDMTTKKTQGTGADAASVRASFQNSGYQVISVVYLGIVPGQSVKV